MTTVVCFLAGGTRYALPVEATVRVRPAAEMVVVPGGRPPVVGVLPGPPALTVIAPLTGPLAGGGGHVLVVRTPERDYGLLVDAVTEIARFETGDIQPAPAGHDDVVVGVVQRPGGFVLIADPTALGAAL